MSIYKEIFQSTVAGLSYELDDTTPSVSTAITLDVIQVEDDGTISISIGSAPKKSTGVKVLLDKVTLALLTTLGESSFNPGLGSFLTALHTQNDTDTLAVYAKISSALTTIQNQILTAQANQVLDVNQKLQELKLSDIYKDPTDPTSILIEVLVVTVGNQEYILTV
jgi:hypothetical protein